MRICLIRCPSPFLIDDKVFPPLGLMAVGTELKRYGHDVTIWDGTGPIVGGFDMYGFGPTTPEYPWALKTMKLLESRVMLGGPHANKSCLDDGWDDVVIGNYVDENLIIDRSLVDIKSYKYFIDGRLATTMVTATGCPYKCAFCSKTGPVKFKSTENVIKEIKMLNTDFGYDALMFFDDTFIIDYNRVVDICKCLKERGIIWRCFVRADLVIKHGKKLLEIMKDSGCVEVGMGIESGSDTILANIGKGETTHEISEAVTLLHDVGIRVKGFFIVGLPGENYQTLEDTRWFIENTRFDDADFTIFKPYPGSRIYNNRDEYDIDWESLPPCDMHYKGKQGQYTSVVRTATLSPDEIVLARNTLEREYKFIRNAV